MADDTFTSDGLSSGLPFGADGISFQTAISAHPELIEEIRQYEPVKSASVFAGLLSEPELQSNCYCLEMLVHLIIAKGNGARKVSKQDIGRWFSILKNGPCGVMDDPAEDVFVSLVSTSKGNFRILEGLWEASGFYLQRVLNIVEEMPDGDGYNQIRESIYALLKISDLIIERAGLKKYQLGNSVPETKLSKSHLNKFKSYRARISFTTLELKESGIDFHTLEPFAFTYNDRELLSGETLGHTFLERYPVAFKTDQAFILLPTSISAAIRRYVYETMKFSNMHGAFLRGMANEYKYCFTNNPILGEQMNIPMGFVQGKDSLISTIMLNVDNGNYLNLIFFVDNLDGFMQSGFSGINQNTEMLTKDIEEAVKYFHEKAKEEADFKTGITLIVGCGIGRGINLEFEKIDNNSWQYLFLGAADFFTLSWVENIKVLSLWRITDAVKKLNEMGVSLFNVNGFLNLVAWAESLKGHLVPHGNIPDEFGGNDSIMMVDQNIIRELRYKVISELDPIRVINIYGRYVSVKRVHHDSIFKEDRKLTLYGVDDLSFVDGMPAVYLTTKRPWWVEVEFAKDYAHDYRFQLWEMLTVWLSRSAPVLDKCLNGFPEGPFLWKVKFEGEVEGIEKNVSNIGLEASLEMIAFDVDHANCIIIMTMKKGFLQSTFQSENIAERAIVIRFVESIISLNNTLISEDKKNIIVNRIVTSNIARQTHTFVARDFRDYVKDSVPLHPFAINMYDEAFSKLGLGWNVHDKKKGSIINGKENCTVFLNSLVEHLQSDICKELKSFNRLKLIEYALRNYESAQINREWWRRTSGAVIALRKNKKEARKTIVEHEMELNSILHAMRLIIDISICECPENDGRMIGNLEFARLTSKILLASNYGGCSDAIHWDGMEPKIVITPLGDIHMNFEFFDNVISPFGRVHIDENITSSINEYAQNTEIPDVYPNVEDKIDPDFLIAWEEEMGVTINEIRQFMDFIDDKGIKENVAILNKPVDYFLPGDEDDISLSINSAKKIINNMTLFARQSWNDIPAGYDKKDCQIWKFKRRLAVLRRPFIQIKNGDSKFLIVAPGLLREAVGYMIGNYYQGDFPVWQLQSRKMRSWAGKSMHKRGNDYSKEVGAKLVELGWQVEIEVPVTKILRKGFDKNYGDIDVLAWSENEGRILLIECKNVQFRKTPGEIAEQITDFRGEIRSDGKPDLLRKHLDRIEVISMYKKSLCEYICNAKDYAIEGHLVFKNPVPMQYAWDNMRKDCPISIHSNLHKFRTSL